MQVTETNWFHDLFIQEAKAVLGGRGGSGGSGDGEWVDPNDPTIVLVDEAGNQVTAVLVDEEVEFTATANDIREGKVAATEDGVTIGTKDIPAYTTTEGITAIPVGRELAIPLKRDVCDFTKMQAFACQFNKSLANSVATEKVVINESVYLVNSTEVIATVIKDAENEKVKFGITNEGTTPCVIRYITYKEEI